MEVSHFAKRMPLLALLLLSLINLCVGTRKLSSLYQPPRMSLKYHKGALLEGNVPVSVIWYGGFTPAQKSIVADFLFSLNAQNHQVGPSAKSPAVSQWWNTIEAYFKKAGKTQTRIVLGKQVTDTNCSMGKLLKRSQITELAGKASSGVGGLTLVLTSQDVAVEGFCMSNCGFHGSDPNKKSAFIWVGNSVTQCPGQCAWPFHQPLSGPQTPPLGAPNGDVGVDGMIINIASLLAGTVTNPFGNGYFMGPAESPLEVASACTGVYGKGAYPGYAGDLLLDPSSGASYNAVGVRSRKYLLPALFDPSSSRCSTLV